MFFFEAHICLCVNTYLVSYSWYTSICHPPTSCSKHICLGMNPPHVHHLSIWHPFMCFAPILIFDTSSYPSNRWLSFNSVYLRSFGMRTHGHSTTFMRWWGSMLRVLAMLTTCVWRLIPLYQDLSPPNVRCEHLPIGFDARCQQLSSGLCYVQWPLSTSSGMLELLGCRAKLMLAYHSHM